VSRSFTWDWKKRKNANNERIKRKSFLSKVGHSKLKRTNTEYGRCTKLFKLSMSTANYTRKIGDVRLCSETKSERMLTSLALSLECLTKEMKSKQYNTTKTQCR
jgi:hypothetical protein